jgi:hypothetical protein
MFVTVGRLGALASTVGGTVVSLGCCAGLLGPAAAVGVVAEMFEWVPLAWRLPVLYGSLALALGSLALAWRRHRQPVPLMLFLSGAVAILYPLHEATDVWVLQTLIWLGFGLLLAAMGGDMWLSFRTPGCRGTASRRRVAA